MNAPMKVKKSKRAMEPHYPCHRKVVDYKMPVGVAAIGLGAAIGQGQEGRLGGDMAAEPRTAGAPPAKVKSVTTQGQIRAEPGSSCTATNRPSAGTNSVPPATPPPVSVCTNKPADVARTPGKPAEPK